ncbi:MAG: hypothetical protein A3I14_17050 [Candidatus Rokubacteria bacterium RIFCSPLOWO2_02_FULL_73_56]|nr:MAG: hypothetical protein A3D33_02735 [Candidatus Rokubacteria bacterium RIFCSPHIGHO2_02_FULL_73_26]OGL10031.1 MAG: hypothetical protein A3I14_17050 [Candidatus Rokubacteria bacterium RIFCSPLOWO2_02_FULL_73_56]OGL22959.1 MAG: hypothetical protein A3G44_17840 [Candidatus Rokubacteria bacterium RIFCSPLOWO2_12_FULL_73_47]
MEKLGPLRTHTIPGQRVRRAPKTPKYHHWSFVHVAHGNFIAAPLELRRQIAHDELHCCQRGKRRSSVGFLPETDSAPRVD